MEAEVPRASGESSGRGAAGMWERVAAAVPLPGKAWHALLASVAARITRGVVEPRHLRACGVTAEYKPLPLLAEVAPDHRSWDHWGFIWGRPGHFPLWMTVGAERTMSDEAKEQRTVRNRKKAEWRSTGVWPWWVFHESERSYWLPGEENTGRGYSGLL